MATPHQLRRAQRNPAASFDHPSSVRTNCVGGIVRPSTLAVLMLIAKSNLWAAPRQISRLLSLQDPVRQCGPCKRHRSSTARIGGGTRGRAGGIVGREAVIGDGTDS